MGSHISWTHYPVQYTHITSSDRMLKRISYRNMNVTDCGYLHAHTRRNGKKFRTRFTGENKVKVHINICLQCIVYRLSAIFFFNIKIYI